MIQDEISFLNLKAIEDAYQEALKIEEKVLRKHNKRNIGKSPAGRRGSSKPRFQNSQNEAGGSSSQPPQRGDFGGRIFGARGRG